MLPLIAVVAAVEPSAKVPIEALYVPLVEDTTVTLVDRSAYVEAIEKLIDPANFSFESQALGPVIELYPLTLNLFVFKALGRGLQHQGMLGQSIDEVVANILPRNPNLPRERQELGSGAET